MGSHLNKSFFIHEKDIEFKSIKLIDRYEKKLGKNITPPIPVMEMVEFLGYDYDFRSDGIYEDLDVLGGINIDEKKIEINEHITTQEGRMFFTFGHEIGHDQLHVPLLLAERAQMSLFSHSKYELNILCRKGADNNDPIEWQANKFASYLLMPTEFVKRVFMKIKSHPINVMDAYKKDIFPVPADEYAKYIAEEVIENGHFENVSKMAMTNRLIGMGLIQGVEYQKNENVEYVVEEELVN